MPRLKDANYFGARSIAVSVAAHAVRNEKDRRAGQEAVLVDRANVADIGCRGDR
jgi:hypothetical protein